MTEKRRQSDQFNVTLWLKVGALILAAGMWLGALQMQVRTLQKTIDSEHEYHYGTDTR